MKTQTLPARSKSEKLAPKKILVPSDFSPASDNAFKYALNFGQHFGAQLHVIHVLEPVLSPQFAGFPEAPAFSEEELAPAEKNLRAWADSAGAVGVAARLVLRNGLPAHEIVETAKDLDVDLIVIAAHGYTGWKHFCIGSTAERVVRAAPCPVLVVREKEHELIGTHTVTAAKVNKPKSRPRPDVTRRKTQFSQRMGVAELNETIREFHSAPPAKFTNDSELMNEAKKRDL